MKKFIFIKNMFILTGTALFLRTIGMFFRVFISKKIGPEGMGLYQLIFSVYILGCTFASSGISLATTRMVADELVCGTKQSVKNILKKTLFLCLILGTLSALIMYFGAPFASKYLINDYRATNALKILSIGLPFLSISSCLHGYFVARRKVAYGSQAGIFEQVVRIGIIMAIIDRFAAHGITYACMAIMIANTVAEICSCLYAYTCYLIDKRKAKVPKVAKNPCKNVYKKLFGIAVPVALGDYLNTVLRTIENLIVPTCLAIFIKSRHMALAQFGLLKGMAMPILFFPSSFLHALSILLVPEISEGEALGKKLSVSKMISKSVYITVVMSILIAGLFFIFSKEIGLLIYNSKDVGAYIRVLAPIVPFMYLESVIDGILKGLNQQISLLKYRIADSVIRIIMIFAVVPFGGMKSFIFVMYVSNALTCILHINRLFTVTGFKIKYLKWVAIPLLYFAIAALLSKVFIEFMMLPHLPDIFAKIFTIIFFYTSFTLLTDYFTDQNLINQRR